MVFDKKTRNGVVINNVADKTIKVLVGRKFMHPLYKKNISKHSKYMVHDANNIARSGDIVQICECRPISKKKKWCLVSIIKKSSI